jgi:hypothetical protein
VINIKNPEAKTRIYLFLEHPCFPRVLVHRTTLRQRQGQEQGSKFRFLHFLEQSFSQSPEIGRLTNNYPPGFAGSFVSAGLGAPNSVVPVPVVPPPNSEVVAVAPPVDGAGLVVFPKILPPLPNGLGAGVGGFPNKLPEVVPVAGVAEVGAPNRPPPVADVVVVVPGVGVVEVAPKSEPPGLEPKIPPGPVVVVPIPVVPVPVVPVPVAGVVVDVVFV